MSTPPSPTELSADWCQRHRVRSLVAILLFAAAKVATAAPNPVVQLAATPGPVVSFTEAFWLSLLGISLVVLGFLYVCYRIDEQAARTNEQLARSSENAAQMLRENTAQMVHVIELLIARLPSATAAQPVAVPPVASTPPMTEKTTTPEAAATPTLAPTVPSAPTPANSLPTTLSIVPVAPLKTNGAVKHRETSGLKPTRVIIAKAVLPQIHAYTSSFLREHGQSLEAGGVLVGEFDRPEHPSLVTIRGFIDAGPKVRATPGSIDFDLVHVNHQLQTMRLQYPQIAHVGCIHRQPGAMHECSGGDAVTDRAAVQEAPTRLLIFGIITIDNRQPTPQALRYENFTLNFYVMSEATGYEYVPVQPALEDLPLIEASPAMSILRTARSTSAILDMAALRSIPEVRRCAVKVAPTQDGPAALCEVSLTGSLGDIFLLCHDTGTIKATRRLPNRRLQPLPGPWEQAESGRRIWTSQVVLECLEQIREPQTELRYRSHFAWHTTNKERFVKEVQAMRQKFGTRATLCMRGDQIYWRYTVRQDGQEMPVEIRYPAGYPASPPEIFSERPLPSSPHQLPNYELCWINKYSSSSEWSPATDTAVICVNAAHRWFACLLIYLTKNEWPKGSSHN